MADASDRVYGWRNRVIEDETGMQEPPWWYSEEIGRGMSRDPYAVHLATYEWALRGLARSAVARPTATAECSVSMRTASFGADDVAAIVGALAASGGRVVVRDDGESLRVAALASGRSSDDVPDSTAGWPSVTLVGPHACVRVDWQPDSRVAVVHVVALGDNLAEAIVATVDAVATRRDPDSRPANARPLYVIVEERGRLGLAELGDAGAPLVRENYAPDVVERFDAAVANLLAPEPHGRLVIVSGPTGTGKTRLLRGVMHAAPGAVFVMIDPEMVTTLTKPHMVPLLLRIRRQHGARPVAFVIEDGDKDVMQRGTDNLSHVQALLNLGGGIAGDMLGVHVFVTTNARVGSSAFRIDEAIVRNGRMAQHVEVDRLRPQHAAHTLRRLRPDVPLERALGMFREPTSLGDVYGAALVAERGSPDAP